MTVENRLTPRVEVDITVIVSRAWARADIISRIESDLLHYAGEHNLDPHLVLRQGDELISHFEEVEDTYVVDLLQSSNHAEYRIELSELINDNLYRGYRYKQLEDRFNISLEELQALVEESEKRQRDRERESRTFERASEERPILDQTMRERTSLKLAPKGERDELQEERQREPGVVKSAENETFQTKREPTEEELRATIRERVKSYFADSESPSLSNFMANHALFVSHYGDRILREEYEKFVEENTKLVGCATIEPKSSDWREDS